MKRELNSRKHNDIHGQPTAELDSKIDYRKSIKKTQLVGIINSTPDSFFDGGTYDPLEQAYRLIDEGADWIDVGGESTRPGATPVTEKEELKRVIPIIEKLKGHPVSIDTIKPRVAKVALEAGAQMLNDVSGFIEPEMRRLAAQSGVLICVTHWTAPKFPNGVITDISSWFEKKIDQLRADGVSDKQIILDPGIGFGKTPEDSLMILRNLSIFQSLGFPLYLGMSRKSFMQKILQKGAKDVLPTTLATATLAMLTGIDYLRVHDVKEHYDIRKLLERL